MRLVEICLERLVSGFDLLLRGRVHGVHRHTGTFTVSGQRHLELVSPGAELAFVSRPPPVQLVG
jgi:hypothetical protein